MSTGFAQANGITICYETFGSAHDPALLLVMGLGVQLIDWEPEFCQMFADRGFYVIRYDNRDVGLSTRVDDDGAGDRPAPYTIVDMADDGLGLLSALGIDAAHVVGTSMGGMIAQTMAIRAPERVLSLCSIMSTTGAPAAGRSTPEARAALIAPLPTTRDGVIAAAVERAGVLRGGGFPFDPDRIHRRAAAAYDRAFDPAGKQRQVAAIAHAEDRTEALGRLLMPVVVIHGAADPGVPLTAGEATARAVPGSELVVIPGMGHELPPGAWATIVDAVTANARRAASATT